MSGNLSGSRISGGPQSGLQRPQNDQLRRTFGDRGGFSGDMIDRAKGPDGKWSRSYSAEDQQREALGPKRQQIAGLAEDQYDTPNVDFSDAFRWLGGQWTEFVITQLTERQLWPFEICPWQLKEDGTTELSWSQYKFHDSSMTRVPEEGTSRYQSNTKRAFKAGLVRLGQSIKLERRMMRTKMGQYELAYKLKQMSNSISMSAAYEIVEKLMQCDQVDEWESAPDVPCNDLQAYFQPLLDNWGIVQRVQNGVMRLLNKQQQQYSSQTQVSEMADAWIMCEGTEMFLNQCSALKGYWQTGSRPGYHSQDMAQLKTQYTYYECGNYFLGDHSAGRNPLVRTEVIGTFFAMNDLHLSAVAPENFRTDMLDTLIWNMSADEFHRWSFADNFGYLNLYDNWDDDGAPCKLTRYGQVFFETAYEKTQVNTYGDAYKFMGGNYLSDFSKAVLSESHKDFQALYPGFVGTSGAMSTKRRSKTGASVTFTFDEPVAVVAPVDWHSKWPTLDEEDENLMQLLENLSSTTDAVPDFNATVNSFNDQNEDFDAASASWDNMGPSLLSTDITDALNEIKSKSASAAPRTPLEVALVSQSSVDLNNLSEEKIPELTAADSVSFSWAPAGVTQLLEEPLYLLGGAHSTNKLPFRSLSSTLCASHPVLFEVSDRAAALGRSNNFLVTLFPGQNDLAYSQGDQRVLAVQYSVLLSYLFHSLRTFADKYRYGERNDNDNAQHVLCKEIISICRSHCLRGNARYLYKIGQQMADASVLSCQVVWDGVIRSLQDVFSYCTTNLATAAETEVYERARQVVAQYMDVISDRASRAVDPSLLSGDSDALIPYTRTGNAFNGRGRAKFMGAWGSTKTCAPHDAADIRKWKQLGVTSALANHVTNDLLPEVKTLRQSWISKWKLYMNSQGVGSSANIRDDLDENGYYSYYCKAVLLYAEMKSVGVPNIDDRFKELLTYIQVFSSMPTSRFYSDRVQNDADVGHDVACAIFGRALGNNARPSGITTASGFTQLLAELSRVSDFLTDANQADNVCDVLPWLTDAVKRSVVSRLSESQHYTVAVGAGMKNKHSHTGGYAEPYTGFKDAKFTDEKKKGAIAGFIQRCVDYYEMGINVDFNVDFESYVLQENFLLNGYLFDSNEPGAAVDLFWRANFMFWTQFFLNNKNQMPKTVDLMIRSFSNDSTFLLAVKSVCAKNSPPFIAQFKRWEKNEAVQERFNYFDAVNFDNVTVNVDNFTGLEESKFMPGKSFSSLDFRSSKGNATSSSSSPSPSTQFSNKRQLSPFVTTNNAWVDNLLNMSIEDGTLMRNLIRHNIKPPVGYRNLRPNIRQEMSAAILTRKGVGRYFYISVDFAVGEDPRIHVVDGSYNFFGTPIITDAARVVRYWHASYRRYLGGMGVIPFDLSDRETIERLRSDGGRACDVLCIPQPMNRQYLSGPIDITGAYSNTLTVHTRESANCEYATSKQIAEIFSFADTDDDHSPRDPKYNNMMMEHRNRLCFRDHQFLYDPTSQKLDKVQTSKGHYGSEIGPGLLALVNGEVVPPLSFNYAKENKMMIM